DVVERVGIVGRPDARMDGEQVQVVVAEHAGRARAQGAHHAQGLERGRSAVDEVAGEPERLVPGKAREQLAQAGGTALDVAYGNQFLRPTAGCSPRDAG